jgi:hypothetical protein
MRAYCPVPAAGLAALLADGTLPGPVHACVVDPAWRAGDPEVDEEQWEFEAQEQAAGSLDDDRGAVLAVDVPAPAGVEPLDGWIDLPGPIVLGDVAAVLTTDLAWFGVQELPGLLER